MILGGEIFKIRHRYFELSLKVLKVVNVEVPFSLVLNGH